MYVPEPRRTWLDLRWRMFGVSVRVHPLFWAVAAALGWGFYAESDRGGLALLCLWIACTLFSLLVHEFGHVAAARLFGARLHVVLYALGSLTTGMDAIKSRSRRLVVLLAGPLAQGILLGGTLGPHLRALALPCIAAGAPVDCPASRQRALHAVLD